MGRYRFDSSRHLHALDGKPLCGTTTVLDVLGKTLTWWSSGEACKKFGWLNPKQVSVEEYEIAAGNMLDKIKQMGVEEYLELLNTAYRAHDTRKKTAATKGTDLHAEIENFIRASMEKKDYKYAPEIQSFVNWSLQNVKRFLFTELHCFSEVLWVGGIADFAFENLDGEYVLGDIKSSPKPYFNQWAQCGGYALQFAENGGYTADGEKVFDLNGKEFAKYAIFCAGSDLGKPFFSSETARLRRAFAYCAALYKEKMFFEGDGK